MKRKMLIGLGVAAALAAGVALYSYSVSAEGGPGYGPGWGMMGGLGLGGGGPCPAFGADEGQGFGPGYHMRGWRGGYGPGWMMGRGYGLGYDRRAENLNLSTDDVKNRIERWLTWRGNPRLKVGEVKEKDADAITADIVTKDNSLVQRLVINRHNGYFRPSED